MKNKPTKTYFIQKKIDSRHLVSEAVSMSENISIEEKIQMGLH